MTITIKRSAINKRVWHGESDATELSIDERRVGRIIRGVQRDNWFMILYRQTNGRYKMIRVYESLEKAKAGLKHHFNNH